MSVGKIGGLPTDRFMTDDKEGNRNARSWTLWFNQLASLVRGMTTTNFGLVLPVNIVVLGLPALDYPNDATASANGVPYGGQYHTGGVVKVCRI